MAINKNFVVKNGFEVSTNLIVADADTRRVGVGTTVALHTLHVNGGIGATNLFVSGITTLQQLNVSGITTLQQLNVSGIITLGITSATNLTSQQLNVSGISTLGITSTTNLTSQQLNVSGISTLGITSATNLTSQQLNVSGISTLGITSTTNLTSQQLNVSGISTLGITSTTNLTSQQLNVSGISTLGITSATNLTSQQLNVSGISTLGVTSTTNLTSQQLNVSGISTLGVTSTTNLTSQQLNVSGISTLGITSTTNLTSQQLNVSGISTLGITSATNLTSQQLNVSGISTLGVTSTTNLTSQQLNVSGISTLGVTSTTNLTSQQLNVSGISTLGITSTTNLTSQQLNVSGISTLGITSATNLTSQQLNVSGISTLGVTSTTNLTSQQLNVSGISTLGVTSTTNLTSQQLNVSGISTLGTVKISSGIITASSGIITYFGDGSGLTNILNAGTATTTTNIPNLTGDITSVNTVTTLATVNSNTGTFGSQTLIPVVTVNAKGLVTAVSTAAVGTALTVAGDSGSVDINLLSETLTISGGINLTSVGSGNTLTFNLDDNISLIGINATGISTLGVTSTTNLTSQQLNVSGISTLGITSTTNLTSQQLNVSGISTLGITSATNLTSQQLNVSGISTLGITSTTNLTSQQLNVSGISTFAGITTITGSTLFTKQLNVSGISTLGITSTTNLTSQQLNVSGISTLGITSATNLTSQQLNVSGVSTLGTVKISSGIIIASSVGIGTTNPTSALTVTGNALISGIITASQFVGDGSDLRNLSGTHIVSYASHSETSNSALSIAGISTYNQVGILTGSLAGDLVDNFGYSVATSADGKTIVVGAYRDEQTGSGDDSGVVYVYDRVGVGNSFNQVGILTGSLAGSEDDFFGNSVATSADGKTIIVGASADEQTGSGDSSGVVYVYDRVGNSFNQVGILTGSLAGDAFDRFGDSVATSADGKTIVVGASKDEQTGSGNDSGVVYVYDRVGNSFNQVGILTGSLAGGALDYFGNSVATSADGKTIIVGAYHDEQTGSGASSGVVYVFDRVGNSFNQVGILTGSLAGDPGDDFGNSVATSADGKTIVVGAPDDEQTGSGDESGVVYVFDRVGNSFNQVGILTGSLAGSEDDSFGYSVATSADGKTIVVGAYTDEQTGSGDDYGVVYVFDRVGSSFNQVGILTGSLAGSALDLFGNSVATSADGKTIIVGAYADEQTGSGNGSGVVYVFDQTRDTYVHSGPTGSIGIGTANPTSKLHVIGDARVGINTSQGVILTSENGTSYRLIVSDAGVLSTILVT
jgi:hypothetical protein